MRHVIADRMAIASWLTAALLIGIVPCGAREHEERERAERRERGNVERRDRGERREEDPEAFERAVRERGLERDAETLAREAEGLKGEPREKAIARLRKLLSEAFNMRQEEMRTEMHELEEALTRVKTLVEKRQKNRDLIIERRIKELTGELDHLEW